MTKTQFDVTVKVTCCDDCPYFEAAYSRCNLNSRPMVLMHYSEGSNEYDCIADECPLRGE